MAYRIRSFAEMLDACALRLAYRRKISVMALRLNLYVKIQTFIGERSMRHLQCDVDEMSLRNA